MTGLGVRRRPAVDLPWWLWRLTLTGSAGRVGAVRRLALRTALRPVLRWPWRRNTRPAGHAAVTLLLAGRCGLPRLRWRGSPRPGPVRAMLLRLWDIRRPARLPAVGRVWTRMLLLLRPSGGLRGRAWALLRRTRRLAGLRGHPGGRIRSWGPSGVGRRLRRSGLIGLRRRTLAGHACPRCCWRFGPCRCAAPLLGTLVRHSCLAAVQIACPDAMRNG